MSFFSPSRAVSLVELLVVVVIIGILAALAIPQLSRGAPGADDSGLGASLSVLRCAIERYYYDHGAYPGQSGDGTHAAGTPAALVNQLTRFTDEHGTASDARSATHRFGPYLRAGIPPCPVPPRLGKTGVAVVRTAPAYIESATEAGWVYNCQTGSVVVNSNETDADGVSYDRH